MEKPKIFSPFFTTPKILTSAILLRAILLLYGLFQDAHSPLKYTDIDYYVFTDAARSISRGFSPYQRETYRYTPLLAWLLLPTTWGGTAWFSFGKVVFALADVVAGWLIVLVLRSPAGGGMGTERALKFASIWLLNPMVATISTRGSSEGLLCVIVVALLWAVMHRWIKLAGVLLGLAVHFKIYPFIYATSIIWYLDASITSSTTKATAPLPPSRRKEPASTTSAQLTLSSLPTHLKLFLTPARLTLTLTSLATFLALNTTMYALYSTPFLTHTYLHHLTRIDHRHNFSPYNTLLYLSSSTSSSQPSTNHPTHIHFEPLAFIPQLLLSAVAIPLVLAKKDLPGAMLAQTFAFVAFNKVCTSQVCPLPSLLPFHPISPLSSLHPIPSPFPLSPSPSHPPLQPPTNPPLPTVFPLVPHPPPPAPPLLHPPLRPFPRPPRPRRLGPPSGALAIPRVPTRIPRREHIRAGTVDERVTVFRGERLGVGRGGGGCRMGSETRERNGTKEGWGGGRGGAG